MISTATETLLSIIKLNNKQFRSTSPLRTPGKVTGVFLAASNPLKLLGTSPAPPPCLASSSLCLGRKVSGWKSLDLGTNWAVSVGWLHLEVQEEEVDHCREHHILGHGHAGHMGPLEARGFLEVRGNQPCLEFLAGPEHHRRRVAPCVLAFQNTPADL